MTRSTLAEKPNDSLTASGRRPRVRLVGGSPLALVGKSVSPPRPSLVPRVEERDTLKIKAVQDALAACTSATADEPPPPSGMQIGSLPPPAEERPTPSRNVSFAHIEPTRAPAPTNEAATIPIPPSVLEAAIRATGRHTAVTIPDASAPVLPTAGRRRATALALVLMGLLLALLASSPAWMKLFSHRT